jgi:hypothetical protein
VTLHARDTVEFLYGCKAPIPCLGNTALYLVTCALLGTGLLLELRMDVEDRPISVLGMGPDDWGEIHFAMALAFVALSILHIALNWPWLRTAFSKHKLAAMVLIAGIVLLMTPLLWPARHGGSFSGKQRGDLLELFD